MLTDVLPSDLGVITPYAAQAAEIRRALRQSGVYDVEVRTVDGFKGARRTSFSSPPSVPTSAAPSASSPTSGASTLG